MAEKKEQLAWGRVEEEDQQKMENQEHVASQGPRQVFRGWSMSNAPLGPVTNQTALTLPLRPTCAWSQRRFGLPISRLQEATATEATRGCNLLGRRVVTSWVEGPYDQPILPALGRRIAICGVFYPKAPVLLPLKFWDLYYTLLGSSLRKRFDAYYINHEGSDFLGSLD